MTLLVNILSTTIPLLLLLHPPTTQGQTTQPHIVIIMADDMGFNDAGFRDKQMITPNIDKLASKAVLLNNSYVLKSCTPSRFTFLTGVYAYRMALQDKSLFAAYMGLLPVPTTRWLLQWQQRLVMPKGDDQVFLPSSNSWGRWSSVDRELDTTVWHSSARRWVLVPPTFPVFADSPPPTFSPPPRGATDSESDEDPEEDHFRFFMEHEPSRARPRTQSLHGQDSGSCRAPSPPDFLEDEAPPGSSVTAGALLEPVLPHFLTTAQPTEKADNEVLRLFGQPSIAPTSVVRLRTPTNVMQSGERLANKARGSKSFHPNSSQDSHQIQSALPVGKVFSLKPLRSRSSNDFEEPSPLFWTADPTPQDRRLLRPGMAPAKLDTSFKDYSDLDRYLRSALMSCSRNQRFLGALAVAHQRAAEGITGAFDDVLTFGRRAVAEVDAAIDTLTEARFNTILTRRDTFLRSSPLSADDRNALRCIPPQPNSLFGQFGSAALRRHSEQARDSALTWASSQPHRQAPKRASYSAPKRASYSQAPAPPAKKPRSGFRQGYRPRQLGHTQTQARRWPPPRAPGRKPPSTF
ncbi:hypothetical protein ACOMHN_017772 [Nucella lapillus]